MTDNQYAIRLMHKEDVPHIHTIGIAAPEFKVNDSDGFWELDTLYRWVASPRDYASIATMDDEIAGFSLASYHAPSRKLSIDNIYVRNESRGLGIATGLAKGCVEHAARIHAKDLVALTEAGNPGIEAVLSALGLTRGKQFHFWHKGCKRYS